MANYVATGPISRPLPVGLRPDVDLGGLKFSYEHGFFYTPVSTTPPITLPPEWDGARVWTGS